MGGTTNGHTKEFGLVNRFSVRVRVRFRVRVRVRVRVGVKVKVSELSTVEFQLVY